MRTVAGRQRGVITFEQLLRLGLSSSAVERLVASGQLHRAHVGVYFLEHPPRPLARETAALLRLGEPSAISDESAGWLWGALARPPRIVRAIAPGKTARGDGRLRKRRATLSADEIRVEQGLRVTSPERTALDLMGCLGRTGRRLAVNELIALNRTTAPKLASACERYAGRRGAGMLRELLTGSNRVSGQRSRGELRCGELLATSHLLPEPARDVWIGGWEIDFYWETAGFYLEVDGGAVHSTPAKFERDRLRDAELQLRGLLGQRVTWRQLRFEAPATLARIEGGFRLASIQSIKRRR